MNTQGVVISDRKMWADQLEARCQLVFTGQYELYLNHGGQGVPLRYTGPLSTMLSVGQAFVDARLREGYTETLPDFESAPIN